LGVQPWTWIFAAPGYEAHACISLSHSVARSDVFCGVACAAFLVLMDMVEEGKLFEMSFR
jgi:hypothetical protein